MPVGARFSASVHIGLGPTHPHIRWVPGHSRSYTGRGVALISTPSSAEVKERVQVYLYSALGQTLPTLLLQNRFCGKYAHCMLYII